MEGVIKNIKNGIFILKQKENVPTIGFHTVAELENGELVDLTDILKKYFGKTTLKKKIIRHLNNTQKGQVIFYNNYHGINKPLNWTFYI